MISLKKHLDRWERESGPEKSVLEPYRSLLLAVAKSSHRALPDLGDGLERKLSELAESLTPKTDADTLEATDEKARAELSSWADNAFLRHEAGERDLREIIDAMVTAMKSVTERDERYARDVGDLTERLRSIAGISDLAVIRRSILESVTALTTCVEHIAEDGRQSLLRLSAEVEDYRSRLDKSERLSSLDALTGLSNRRLFEEHLNFKIHAGNRFCLILMDLNDFKEVNDRYGHLAGDEVLKYFAAKLRTQFPSADMVARWGGDEFAIIIASSQNDVEARVHRIRRSALGECKVSTGKQTVTVLVDACIGVVEWDGRETGAEMVARADLNMYHGKEAKRTEAKRTETRRPLGAIR